MWRFERDANGRLSEPSSLGQTSMCVSRGDPVASGKGSKVVTLNQGIHQDDVYVTRKSYGLSRN